MDDFIIAMSRYKRRKYDQAITLCDSMLQQNPRDQAAWLLKCNSLIRKQYIDDLDIDEEGIGDILMDENTISSLARPGTSLQGPSTSYQQGGSGNINPIVRPMSKSGRPITGFARPGTNRPTTSSNGNRLDTAMRSNVPGTARPITSGGRYIRLGTASISQQGDAFLQTDKLDMKKMAKKGAIARAICNYLLYVENNPKKALELASEATIIFNYKDWWWKERLGKCYYMLGLHREAEKQFISSIKNEDIIKTNLELARVYVRLDQPVTSVDILSKGSSKYPHEITFILETARIYDQLNQPAKAIEHYKEALSYESSNLEAVASIAAYHFYIDQPEVSMKFYQRLLQLGVNTAELWNNLGLCLFYDGQYDLFYSCFERALDLADESNKADIWYNLSHIFINLGDVGMAYQCLKLVLCNDPHHAEAFNNIGILDIKKKNNIEKGRFELQTAMKEGTFLLEPHYNAALWSYKLAEYQEAYELIKKALNIYPQHTDSKELMKNIEEMLKVM